MWQTSARPFGMSILALVVASCGSSPNPTAPSIASPVTAVDAATPRSVSPVMESFVLDTSMAPLAGATVEVLDGPQAGTSLVADAAGRFLLTGAFLSTDTFRASQEGYVPLTQGFSTSTPGGPPWLMFHLKPVGPSVDLTGDYSLTIIADSACSDVPAPVPERTYAATIAKATTAASGSGGEFTLTVTDTPVVAGLNGFGIGVAGNVVGVLLHGGHDPALVAQIGPAAYLAYSGYGRTVIESPRQSTITIPMEGWVEYCVLSEPLAGGYHCGISSVTGQPIPGVSAQRTHCDSSSHRLVLTRR